MNQRRAALLAITLLISLGESAAAQPDDGKADAAAAIAKDHMLFYLAKGDADACGAGCAEWIAAEGSLDLAAPRRLRALLASLGGRNLPIFFYSPGGFRPPAIEIGRLLRERDMTAGVSKTVVAGCSAADDDDCRRLKASGQTLEAELYHLAGCSSACVFALIGARSRNVPPGARIGVHTGRDDRSDLSGFQKAVSNAQVGRYLREMGIADGLLDAITSVPHERMRYLSRNELAAFGIDSSEFRETRWHTSDWLTMAMEWPPRFTSIVKFMTQATRGDRADYRMSIIRVACTGRDRVGLGYVRGLGPDRSEEAGRIELAVDGGTVSLPERGPVSKLNVVDAGSLFEIRFVADASEFIERAATQDRIDLIESDPTDPTTSPRIVKLSTAGLPKALARLKQACIEREARDSGGIRLFDMPGSSGRR
jgi:hypothetical protein